MNAPVNYAATDTLAERLWATNAPPEAYSSPVDAGLLIGRLQTSGDALAIAILRDLPTHELKRIALDWVRQRGVQVTA